MATVPVPPINGHEGTNGVVNGGSPTQNGTMNGDTPRSRGKKGGVGPEGYPRLPPITKPSQKADDPYANSKLMTFRLANHKQAMLMKIL